VTAGFDPAGRLTVSVQRNEVTTAEDVSGSAYGVDRELKLMGLSLVGSLS